MGSLKVSDSVSYLQIIDEHGHADTKQMPDLSTAQLKKLFEWMVLARGFDDKCLKLQRGGKLGTFAQILGQEAQVGAALAMTPQDWLVPCFRENGLMMALGVSMTEIFQAFGGDERGFQFSGKNVLPMAIPVGTHMLHAAGIAWALQKKKQPHAVLTVFGDGATSEGDFHEAMNFAGVFKLPVVFLCQNNAWAISVPVKAQTASESIAQKALAYGFEGVQIDGNDVVTVYKAVQDAMQKARNGNGPTLIEMMTYRMGDHTTADNAQRYRDAKEVAYWKKRDPIDRLRLYLKSVHAWSQSWETKLDMEMRKRIEDAANSYELLPRPPVTDMFDFLVENPSVELARQRAMAQSLESENSK